MKTLVLFLLAGATVNATAQQQEILFKQEIKPDKQYTWIVKSVSNSSLDVSGSEEEIQKMKTEGQTFPSIRESSSEDIRVLKTGSIKVDKSFPATLTYIKSTEINVENGKRTASRNPDPIISISGIYDSKNKFKVVSVIDSSNQALSKKQFYAYKTNYEKLQKKLSIFPNKPIKIGESFDHKGKARLLFPGCSNPVIMTISSNYKLKKIENNIAAFDIVKTVGLDVSSQKGNMNVIGNGIGIAEFDINLSYIVKEELNNETVIKLIINGLQMTAVYKTKTNQDVKIE